MKESNHSQPENLHIRVRLVVLVVLALGLALLSVQGAPDRHGRDQIEDTTNEAIAIFLVARTINAAVSTLQTSTVGAGFTLQIGEALDPINDAIERLSSVMVWVIGSLLLQGIAIDLVASDVFRWGFAVIAVSTALLLYAADRHPSRSKKGSWVTRYRDLTFRLFVVAAMIRFAVPAFVVISVTLSEMVVQDRIDESRSDVELQSAVIDDDSLTLDDSVDAPGNLVADSNSETESTDDQSLLDGFLEQFAAIREAASETFSGFNLPNIPDIETMRDNAATLVESITRLLVYIAIKNILLPLVFLIFALKGAIPLTRYLSALGTSGAKSQN